ncbi:MAG: hypothetical protein CEO22_137, partial [Candidatus Berkelbacteria bacterium Gr01-1014_85]
MRWPLTTLNLTQKQPMNKSAHSTQQILILGAGFAGLRAASDLTARFAHRRDI